MKVVKKILVCGFLMQLGGLGVAAVSDLNGSLEADWSRSAGVVAEDSSGPLSQESRSGDINFGCVPGPGGWGQ